MLKTCFSQTNSARLPLTPNSVDLVVTSPPYKDCDGYSDELISRTFWRVFEAMKPTTLCFVNFGHLAGQKTRPFHVVEIIEKENNCQLEETFIWVKNHYKPIQGKRRVNNLFEYVFMFSKGRMRELDRLAVGVPYADKSNVGRYSDRDLKCAGNVLYIPYETIQRSEQKLHHDRFPVALPAHFIKLAKLTPSSLILDPFCGSGSTALAALECGHRFIGFDYNYQWCQIAKDRINGVFDTV